jgi:hypothetical protein
VYDKNPSQNELKERFKKSDGFQKKLLTLESKSAIVLRVDTKVNSEL